MTAGAAALLVVAGVAAGLSGSIAGLASLFSYPALLAAGLPATAANVTNTVSLAVGSVGAVAGSRPELTGQARVAGRLGVACVLGGAAGALLLLLLTPPGVFERVVPVLVGGASLTLLLRRRARPADAGEGPAAGEGPGAGTAAGDGPGAGPAADEGPGAGTAPGPGGAGTAPGAGRAAGSGRAPGRVGRALLTGGAFATAVYGGYFGAAAGVLMLALLHAALRESLVRVNALKNLLLGLANAVAAVGFAAFGPVSWAAALPMTVGLLAGSWAGPAVARRVPAGALRVGIALAGLGLAAKLAFDAW